MIVGLFQEIDEGRATAMAESKSMTIEQVVREVMADEHADVLREAVRLVVQELMNAEVSELIGAEPGERTPDRATWRNGYRSREWDTRVGVIELGIPKLRQGSYFPHGLLEPRKRGEQALLAVVQQAYVCGVSTRRVDQLVETLGLRISRSEVSRVCALLDEQVEAFRQRPLEGDYPYLWLDAKVEKVRDGGRVIGKAVVSPMACTRRGGARSSASTSVPPRPRPSVERAAAAADQLASVRRRGLRAIEGGDSVGPGSAAG
jgi:putative transposase